MTTYFYPLRLPYA